MRLLRSRWSLVGPLGLAALLIVAACGGGGATATPRPQPTSPPAATPTPAPTRAAATPTPAPTATATPVLPKRGGILKTRILGNPSRWNILEGPITSTFPLFLPVTSSIIQFDVDQNKITGDLAQSWSVGADGKQLIFKIRPGVKWHDGKPLTAGDLKFNLDATFFETLGFKSHLQGLFPAAKSVEAPDEQTVVINLSKPSNSFLRNMTHAMMVNYAPQVSQDDLKAGKVVGTNAFMWTKFQKDIKVEQRAFPGYWDKGADGKALPYVEGVDFFMIPDTTAHISAMRTGQIDVFDHINDSALPGQIDNIKSSIPGLLVTQTADSWAMVLVKNKAPFTNLAVRQALQYGLNRQEFIEAGLKGFGVPAGFANAPTDFGGQTSHSVKEQEAFPGISAAKKSQDIQEAQRLLASAGFTKQNPLKALLTVVGSGSFPDEAIVVANLWNRIEGVQIEVKAEPDAIHAKRLVVPGGDFELLYRPFAEALDDPTQTIGLFWVSKATRNYGEWSDPAIDQLFEEQETVPDAKKRLELNRQIEERLYQQAYNIVAAWRTTPHIARPDIKGVPSNAVFSNEWRYDKGWIDR